MIGRYYLFMYVYIKILGSYEDNVMRLSYLIFNSINHYTVMVTVYRSE